MTRPSPLYRRLGITGEALTAMIGLLDVSSQLTRVSIRRGSDDPSSWTPSVATLETVRNISPAGSAGISIQLSPELQQLITARTGVDPTIVRNRYWGKIGTSSAHDTRHGWRGTTITSSSWSSLLKQAPETWNGIAGRPLSAATAVFSALPWESRVNVTTSSVIEEIHEPAVFTADQWLNLLASHGYVFREFRSNTLNISSLADRRAALTTVSSSWPLARAHVLEPIQWHQPNEYPIEYELRARNLNGTEWSTITAPDGIPTGTTRLETLNWLSTRQIDTQWQRIRGMRRATRLNDWQLPSLTIRLDHLLSAPWEGHRRAAGMLLSLDVGDWIGLAADWPEALQGAHLVTGLDEELTPNEWTLTLSTIPRPWLDGMEHPTIKPRTWAQTAAAWREPSETWQEGPSR